MSFIYMRMKNHFHIKGWALNLVMIQIRGPGKLVNGLFCSRRIDLTPRTSFLRPKTCYCKLLLQQQSLYRWPFLLYPPGISLSPVLPNETKYGKISDGADFANCKTYSFVMLTYAFWKTCAQGSEKTPRQPSPKAEFSLLWLRPHLAS